MSRGGAVESPPTDDRGESAQPRSAVLLAALKRGGPRAWKALTVLYAFLGHPLIVLAVLSAGIGSVWLQANQMRAIEQALIAPGVDHGIVSLELSRSVTSAHDALGWWQTHGATASALCDLEHDERLIRQYELTGAVLFVYCLVFIPWRWNRIVISGLPLLVFAAGALDRRENAHLQIAIADATHVTTPVCAATAPVYTQLDPPSTGFETAINDARNVALAKFALLTGAWCGVLGLAGIQLVRLRTTDIAVAPSTPATTASSFRDLHRLEMSEHPDPRKREDAVDVRPGPGGENWVFSRRTDIVGLALSGGGIRSATFNLGLLQGFSRFKGVLPLIDFVSTVSGGGYIGGAWSAWRARTPRADHGESLFVPDGSPTRHGETAQVRHLREFSNFLIPRWGIFEVATWQAVIAVVAGLIPALLTALSVILLAVLAYVASTFYFSRGERFGAWTSAGFVASALVAMEIWWLVLHPKPSGQKDRASSDEWWTQEFVSWGAAILGVLAVFRIHAALSGFYAPIGSFEIWSSIVVPESPSGWIISPRLFEIGVASLATALVYVAVRFLLLLFLRSGPARPAVVGFDRVLMRILGVGTIFVVMAAIWHLGLNLRYLTGYLIAATGAAGGTFALLRNWLTTLQKPQSPGPFAQLKGYVPQVLAYLTLMLAGAAIASVLVNQLDNDLFHWWLAGSGAATVVMVMLFVDPQAVGLHRFYCDRLARAYVGASNPQSESAADNRQYDVRLKDDVLLRDLPPGPHHLICCAANDLSADQVTSLSRGARSAVLSRHGVTVGDQWGGAATDLSLSSAVTASAAAFNSNMGNVSVTLGPAVAFLMCALNLRLGLWVRYPGRSGTLRALPGSLFFKEMFQATLADGTDRDVHLSDGGHFENLGLYELVRRHCRYIIVSDASADPDVAFDDFGIAARRVRQDFGVDIRIDLSALKHDENSTASQHVVVGVIDYDGALDKGLLLYVKPTLTGDEEPDIRQYRERNKAFPHESTGDQFYDEAQWESYRRLGDHTGQSMLRYLLRRDRPLTSAPELFMGAREEWFPTPEGFAERVLNMTSKLSEVESDLKELDSATITHELFPELQLMGVVRPQRGATADIANLAALLRMLQLMEDVWVACELDTFWNHPLNLGWMNCFWRWATTPTFCMWWPILSPMYGSGFLRFMREQFKHLTTSVPPGRIETWQGRPQTGLAWHWWSTRLNNGDTIPAGKTIFSWHLALPRAGTAVEMQVGLVALTLNPSTRTATWDVEDFFVPPSLWNGGIGSPFLRALCETLRTGTPATPGLPVKECRVTMKQKGPMGRAGRAEQLGYVEFYKSADFQLEQTPTTGKIDLVRRW